MSGGGAVARRWGPALGARVLVALLAAAATLRLAAVLDGAGFGRLYIVLTVAQLAGAAAEAGMPMVLARSVAIGDERGDRVRVAALFRAGLRRAGAAGVGLGVAAGAVTGMLLRDVSVGPAVILVAAWATHLAVAAVVEATLTSLRAPARSQLPRLAGWVTVIGGSVVARPTGVDDATGLFLAGSLVGLAVALVLAGPSLRVGGSVAVSPRAVRDEIGDRWRFTGLVRLVNAAVPVGEAAMVSAVVGPVATGTVGVARSLARPMTLLASSVASVIAPDLAVAHQQGGREQLWEILARVWRVVVPLALVATVGLGAVAIVVIEATVEGYPSVLVVTVVLLAAGAVNLATGPVGIALQMADGERQLVSITVGSAALLLVLVAIGGSIAGAPGAATGSLLAAVVNNGWCILGLRPRGRTDPARSAVDVTA